MAIAAAPTANFMTKEVFDYLNDSTTATSTSLAATASARNAVITTEALTTAAGASAAFVITNTQVAIGDIVHAQMIGGTNTAGALEIKCVAAAGSVTITLTNRHASAAFNGTFKLGVVLFKTA